MTLGECLSPTLSDVWKEFYVAEDIMPDFLLALSRGIANNDDTIRDALARHAPEWPLNKIHPIDRCVLFIGIYELLFERDTPSAVVINECVELAKTFGTENSGKFVNGVLNTLKEREERVSSTDGK
jgi:N utilization substance protein B